MVPPEMLMPAGKAGCVPQVVAVAVESQVLLPETETGENLGELPLGREAPNCP